MNPSLAIAFWGFIILIAGSAFMAGALYGHTRGWREARRVYEREPRR